MYFMTDVDVSSLYLQVQTDLLEDEKENDADDLAGKLSLIFNFFMS